MSREEIQDLLIKIQIAYPSWKPENKTETINVWHEYLKDVEQDFVLKALREYITLERNTFAPSISDLYNLAKKYKPDPRFEGVDYWEMRTKGIYPYDWDSKAYREWYTTDRESGRFFKYLMQGIEKAERREIPESELDNLESVLKVYEKKKCLMMKKA